MSRLEARLEDLGGATRVRLEGADGPCSFERVVRGWASDEPFRAAFLERLAAAPGPAWFWELPPVTRGRVERPFEFVLVPSPRLARMRADPGDFAEPFGRARGGTAAFWNLGGDALLVAPLPPGSPGADVPYAHLASFVRGAPEPARHELLRALAEAVAARLSDVPLWISTSGLGVPWLHVRLDARPKYYQHAPYRTWPRG